MSSTAEKIADESSDATTSNIIELPIFKKLSNHIVDGRIFEADKSLSMTSAEKAEIEEFNKSLRKYNALSKKQLMNALERELKDLKDGNIKEVSNYFDGTVEDRINFLNAELKTMEELEKKSGAASEK